MEGVAANDLRSFELPAATLTDQEAAEVVGVLILFPEFIDSFARPLREAETACMRQAEEWGSKGFSAGGDLTAIFRVLSTQIRPIYELLPLNLRHVLRRREPAAVRVLYYLWLKLWREASDDFVYAAALLHGCFHGGFVGLVERIHRNAEILFVEHGGRDEAFSFLEHAGLRGPATIALMRCGDSVGQSEGLVGSVVGFAHKRGVPSNEDDTGAAGLALAKNLPPFPGILDTETRRVVRAAGMDFIDKRRGEVNEPLMTKRAASASDTGEEDALLGLDKFLSRAVLRSPDNHLRDKLARTPEVVLLDALDSQKRVKEMDAIAARFQGTIKKVYQLLRDGKEKAEIAKALGITRPAVSQHVQKIRAAMKPFDPN